MSSWWDNVADLVERARALPESERAAFLNDACAGDAALRRDVEMVLGSDAPDEFLEPAEHVLPAGHVLGEFTLLRPVGRGGMGVVYLARQAGLREAAALEERLAAVKVFPRTREADAQGYERFLREAEAATSLLHPGLVNVLASGQSEGVAWYAMPYIDGHDLHVELERQRKVVAGAEAGGPLILPPFGSERYLTAALEAMANVADAVDHVHRRQVIHRDIKPRNLLLDRGGTIRIADFGLAKILSLATLTQTGQHLGTPYYMSPEQARAINNPVDERTDIYSMGVVLFEMLSLKNHVRGRSAQEIIRRIASGETLRLEREAPRTPRDLVTICEKALSVRPGDRYPTASAFAADLRHVLHREAIDARPRTRWQRSRDWTLRHPVLMVASALIVLAVIAGAWWSGYRADQQRIGDWKTRLDAALVLPEWRGEESVAADAREAVEDIRQRGEVPHELGELVGQFEARLAQDRNERLQTARTLIDHGRGGPIPGTGVDPYIAPPSPTSIIEGALAASQALTVHPGDATLSSMMLFGTDVVIRLDADFAPHAQASGPAHASAYALDAVLEEYGPRRDLGELPVEVQLAPGHWRFVVELPGVGFAEFDREYSIGATASPIVARVHPDADVQAESVLLPSVTLTLDDPRELGCTLPKREIDVSAVWIREAEVSNGEYLEFLVATGHKAPFGWINAGYPEAADTDHATAWRTMPGVSGDARFLELPATGMSYRDMQSYAEWRGMRLPTHHEMEYALRGLEMRRTPPAGAHTSGQRLTQGAPATTRFAHYVAQAVEVRSGERLAPHGLFHIYGNAHEMTSGSVTVNAPPGRRLVALLGERIHMGASWAAVEADDPIYNHWILKTDDQLAQIDVGFRCVRSAALPTR